MDVPGNREEAISFFGMVRKQEGWKLKFLYHIDPERFVT